MKAPLSPHSSFFLVSGGVGRGDREDVALSYVCADSGCVAASWLCVLCTSRPFEKSKDPAMAAALHKQAARELCGHLVVRRP